jgi:hypothetical protein
LSVSLFSPVSKKNWLLTAITDSYSRFILDAKLTEAEDIDRNIKSLESIFKTCGFPKTYHIYGYISDEAKKNIKDNKISENNDLSPYSCFYTDRAYSLF